jgi:hypothetical protein
MKPNLCMTASAIAPGVNPVEDKTFAASVGGKGGSDGCDRVKLEPPWTSVLVRVVVLLKDDDLELSWLK